MHRNTSSLVCVPVSDPHSFQVWLWDPKTGEPLGQCHGHKKWITSLAWEPAHKAYPCARFCTGSKDNMIKVGGG